MLGLMFRQVYAFFSPQMWLQKLITIVIWWLSIFVIYFRRELLKNKQAVYLTYCHISSPVLVYGTAHCPPKVESPWLPLHPWKNLLGGFRYSSPYKKNPFQECTLTHKPCLLRCLALPISLLRFFIFSKHISPHLGDFLCLVSTAQHLSSQTRHHSHVLGAEMDNLIS